MTQLTYAKRMEIVKIVRSSFLRLHQIEQDPYIVKIESPQWDKLAVETTNHLIECLEEVK